MILTCTCANKAQDRLHGSKMRVCNECKDGSYRCTVCKASRQQSGHTPPEKKKK